MATRILRARGKGMDFAGCHCRLQENALKKRTGVARSAAGETKGMAKRAPREANTGEVLREIPTLAS